jgi:hypothetical protein
MTKKQLMTALRKAGACEDGLAWAESYDGTAEEIISAACPEWLLWAAGRVPSVRPLITAERLDACAVEMPWYALEFAAKLMTAERRAWCEKNK